MKVGPFQSATFFAVVVAVAVQHVIFVLPAVASHGACFKVLGSAAAALAHVPEFRVAQFATEVVGSALSVPAPIVASEIVVLKRRETKHKQLYSVTDLVLSLMAHFTVTMTLRRLDWISSTQRM